MDSNLKALHEARLSLPNQHMHDWLDSLLIGALAAAVEPALFQECLSRVLPMAGGKS